MGRVILGSIFMLAFIFGFLIGGIHINRERYLSSKKALEIQSQKDVLVCKVAYKSKSKKE